jgi:hypothetical protein
MACLICRDLERTLDFRRSKYFEARSAAYYQVSTEVAAQKKVDMGRAKSDLEEHQLVCVTFQAQSRNFAGRGDSIAF